MAMQVLGNNPRSVNIKASNDDIQKYIIYQLGIDPHCKLINEDLRQQLFVKIPQNSQGMFLLAALQMQVILQELTIANRKAAIEKLPQDLYAAFRISLERIHTSPVPVRELGIKVLMWVHLARRQLHIEEILHALAVKDGAADLDPDNIPLEETVLHCCNGLVIIDHETSEVRLVHYSLQEFFKLHFSEYFLDGHKKIAHTCLTYLNFTPLLAHCTEVAELKRLLLRYHLFEYAAGQWGHHAVHQFDDTLKPLALRLLGPQKSPAAVQFCFWDHRVVESITPPSYRLWNPPFREKRGRSISGGLHVAAHFGIELIVQYLLKTPPEDMEIAGREDGNRNDSILHPDFNHSPLSFNPSRTPLSLAAAQGHSNVVSLLLQHNMNINECDRVDSHTPISRATKLGQKHVVRQLLKHPDIDVNAGYEPALVYAVIGGHEDLVRLFLEHPKIDVNRVRSPRSMTALSYAAMMGHEGIARLLLEHPNIDVNGGYELALVYADSGGYEDRVRLFPNIDVNVGNHWNRTTLSYVATKSHENIVRLLLVNSNIDVNAAYEPALFSAAKMGHEDIVRVHPDIDVDATKPPGDTWLSVAIGKQWWSSRTMQENIVHLLLRQREVNVHIRDHEGRTPLEIAIHRSLVIIADLLRQHPNISLRNVQTPACVSQKRVYEIDDETEFDTDSDLESYISERPPKRIKVTEI